MRGGGRHSLCGGLAEKLRTDLQPARSKLLGWQVQTVLRKGIAKTHAWVEEQVQQCAV